MHKPLSWYKDIGMFGMNRPINDIPEHNILGSCTHRTSFCDITCYNLKLYKIYKTMKDKDVRDEKFWQYSQAHCANDDEEVETDINDIGKKKNALNIQVNKKY